MLAKAAKKADKTAKKLEKAEAKLPKKTVRKMYFELGAGKPVPKVRFEEQTKPPPKLSHVPAAPAQMTFSHLRREATEDADENVAVESVEAGAELAQTSGQKALSAHRQNAMKPYRAAAKAERQADKANLHALNQQAKQNPQTRQHPNATQNPQFTSNPISRWQQKRAIRKEYAAAKRRGETVVNAAELTKRAVQKAGNATEKLGAFLVRHKKGFLVVIAIAVMLIFLLNMVSSCSVILETGISAIGATTYPSKNSDMLNAEQRYCAMESALQSKLDNYESTHDYDEYRFDLDEIGHDPYVLISAVTALHGGLWEVGAAQSTLQMLFDKQYILTESVLSETRYKTETVTVPQMSYNPETGQNEVHYVTTTQQVPYTYRICTVKLENMDLSHVPVAVMTEAQLSMYSVYMHTLGNRPDLFGDSQYVEIYINTKYPVYDIPPEVLSSTEFSNLIKEAEKYLGYPYVWGGSSPSTSFDCSGFVCWAINNCGNGWNVGRTSAEGLRQYCRTIAPANAQPGDLVFFQKTYGAASGATHVGIYVGNNVMLHCGDPIRYTRFNTAYWQEHFLSFGRLP